MKIRFLVILFTWLFTISLSAQDIKLDLYYASEGDTLESIAKEFLPGLFVEYDKNLALYMSDLKKWNPHIKDWRYLSKGTPLYKSY